MRRREDFEDDGRTIADMSGMESPGMFGRRPSSSQTKKEQPYDEGDRKNPWEDAPFTWKERFHYMGMALGAALLIAFVFLAGIALIIWLITLYA